MDQQKEWEHFDPALPFDTKLSPTLYKYGRWKIDIKQNDIHIDETFAQILGVLYETPSIKSLDFFYDFIVPDNRELVRDLLYRTAKTGEDFLTTYSIRKINGDIRRILTVGKRFSTERGNCIHGIAVDITEKQHLIDKFNEKPEIAPAENSNRPTSFFQKMLNSTRNFFSDLVD